MLHFILSLHSRLKCKIEKMDIKWTKLECLFLGQKTFKKTNMVKIVVNVQKRLKGASAEGDFCHGENKEHAEEKSSK